MFTKISLFSMLIFFTRIACCDILLTPNEDLVFKTTGTNVAAVTAGFYGVGDKIDRQPLYFANGSRLSRQEAINFKKSGSTICILAVSGDAIPENANQIALAPIAGVEMPDYIVPAYKPLRIYLIRHSSILVGEIAGLEIGRGAKVSCEGSAARLDQDTLQTAFGHHILVE